MTIALWILGYLIVGFGVAVWVYRVRPDMLSCDSKVAIAVLMWPFPVTGLLLRRFSLLAVVKWCARRLP